MTTSSEADDGPTREQRAENAAQSLHSAELEWHAVSPATQNDTAEYVSGEIDAQEHLRRVRSRYGVPTDEPGERFEGDGAVAEAGAEQTVPIAYTSIDEAAHAYAEGLLDDDGFVAVALTLAIVKQNPMPDHEWFDDWARIDGPLSHLQDAFSRRLIPAHLYDATLKIMAEAEAGHEA